MGKSILNILPVISQLKSLVQVTCGDVDGAERTQQEFSKGCPIVSQCRSLVELATGDVHAARETQVFQARTLEYIAEATPVVGHMAAGVHLLKGDKKKAKHAANHATKTTVAVSTGFATFFLCPPAAPVAAYGAGVVYDGLHSAATQRPQGIVAVTHRICTNQTNPGEVFDAVAGLAAVGAGVAIAEPCVFETASTDPQPNASAVPTQAPVVDVVAAVATGAADAISNQGNAGQATVVVMEQQPLLPDSAQSDDAIRTTQDGTSTADTAAPKDQPKSQAEKAGMAAGKEYVKKVTTSASFQAGPRNMSYAPMKQE